MVRNRSIDGKPALIVRRSDTYRVWTWIALAGLVIAILLAIVGLPRVDIHGPLHYLGVMDPLCGGTRSVYLTLHGQLGEAVRYNPAGPFVVIGAVVLVVRAAVGWSTRHWIDIRVSRWILIPVTVVALVALEVNQQMNVTLLTQPWGGA